MVEGLVVGQFGVRWAVDIGNKTVLAQAVNMRPARPLPAETRAYVAALAPVLLGERPSGGTVAAARPLDWREAAIFISRDDGTFATDPVSPHPTVGAAPSPVPAVPQAGITPQPEGLFVQRETGEARP